MDVRYLYLAVIALLILGGCSASSGPVYYKGIEGAEVPESCLEYKDDACDLLSCMVAQCWCDEFPPGPVLYEKERVVISSEEQAISYVQGYLEIEDRNGIMAKRAVKLNDVFYNVFTEDDMEAEDVLTVAVDGTIIRIVCGV